MICFVHVWDSLFLNIIFFSSVTELMTARLLISYFEIAKLRCSERDIIPASVDDLLVFVCTGTPMANLIALLSILCSFFRSVFGAEKCTS